MSKFNGIKMHLVDLLDFFNFKIFRSVVDCCWYLDIQGQKQRIEGSKGGYSIT